MIEYRTAFDEALVANGPPAVFTVDSKGQLGIDDLRTRDHWHRVDGEPVHEICHCLFRDRATGFVQYVLVTSPALCAEHPRADIAHHPDQATALAALDALGNPPIDHSDWP